MIVPRSPKASKTKKEAKAVNPNSSKLKSKKRNYNEIISEADKIKESVQLNEISKEKTRKLLFQSNLKPGVNLIKNQPKPEPKKESLDLDYKDVEEAEDYELVDQVFGNSYKGKRSRPKNKNYIKDFKAVLNQLEDSGDQRIRSGSFDDKKKNKTFYKNRLKGRSHYAHNIDYSENKDTESINYREKNQVFKKSYMENPTDIEINTVKLAKYQEIKNTSYEKYKNAQNYEKLIRDELEKAINKKIEPVIKENRILKENNPEPIESDDNSDKFKSKKKGNPISYNANYEFPDTNIKMLKLITRGSKKNQVIDLDLIPEKNPDITKYPVSNYQISDFMHEVYETRHRYLIYLNLVKDDQLPDTDKINLSKSFLLEDKNDIYSRNLCVYCFRFLESYGEDEIREFSKKHLTKLPGIKNLIVFYNSDTDEDYTIICYIKFSAGKKLPKDLFKGYNITRIKYVYFSDKELFELSQNDNLLIAYFDSDKTIQEKYEQRGNIIIENKRRKDK